jgi:hypothetical protein
MVVVRVSRGDEEPPVLGGTVVCGGVVVVGAVVEVGMVGRMVVVGIPDIGPDIDTKLLGSLLLPLRK